MKRETLRVPDKADWVLSKIKYVVLVLIIVLSYRVSELVFRGYDPFYTLFTAGKGHGLMATWSLVILGAVLVGSFLFEMAWCRYLCPLGAVMDPLSKIGLVKVKRGAACNRVRGVRSGLPPADPCVETLEGDAGGLHQLPGVRVEVQGARGP